MYITINNKGEKRIDLFYPIKNFDFRKEALEGPHFVEVAVIAMLSDNVQYEVEKGFTFIPPISPGDKVLILSRSYAGRELISVLGMVDIVNFSFFSSNIPSSPSYGVYISQLIRYARCCSYYHDFGYRHKLLVDRLLSQGYEVKCLRNSFKSFMADILISLGSIRGR